MDLIGLPIKIRDSFADNDFVGTIQLIEEYLSDRENGAFDWILDIYSNCQIKLGLFEEAQKTFKLIVDLFPNFYSPYNLALRYAKFGMTEELKNIMSNCIFAPEEYYKVAQESLYNRHYAMAYDLFAFYINISDNEELIKMAKNYSYRINTYIQDNNTFISTSYFRFKEQGNKLQLGDVIYVTKLRDEYELNKLNNDEKRLKRPYMVWKTIDDVIYAFPITTVVKGKESYMLYRQNYINANCDRNIKDTLVCIEERDVYEVSDKITEHDCKILLENVYVRVCFSENYSKERIRLFIDYMKTEKRAEKHEVITVYDKENGSARHYFVIDIDERKGKYKTVELERTKDYKFKISSKKRQDISMKKPIIFISKLEEDEKSKILSKVPSNLKEELEEGTIVRYGSKKYEVMIKDPFCYICVDRTREYSPTRVPIKLLQKDTPVFVIGKEEPLEYNKRLYTLQEYVSRKPGYISTKKKLLQKELKRSKK